MNQDIIHVYFMPGMAANPSIFEHIQLPENQFKIHWLEWEIPLANESLTDYALRISKFVKHENPVLIGVSFGGILVQEMSRFVNPSKLIIISSVKSRHELPRRMRIAKVTKAYKLMPTSIMGNLELMSKLAVGSLMNKRVELYKKYMSVGDKRYLDWAIDKVINWSQEEPIENIIHIHGNKDLVFPYTHIKDCITVEGGTHIMIINRFKWFNENLPNIIQES